MTKFKIFSLMTTDSVLEPRLFSNEKNNLHAMKNHLLFPVVSLNSHYAANITVIVILKL